MNSFAYENTFFGAGFLAINSRKAQMGIIPPLSGDLKFFERPSCTCQHVEIGTEEQRI